MGTTSSLVMNVTISATTGNRKGNHYKDQHRKINIVDDLRTLFSRGIIISLLVKDLSQSGYAKISHLVTNTRTTPSKNKEIGQIEGEREEDKTDQYAMVVFLLLVAHGSAAHLAQ
jgi:hypothetical protein